MKLASIIVVVAMWTGAGLQGSAGQQAEPERRTVWSGVYTDDQADFGAREYMTYCSSCHGPDLEGVANLKGRDFMERWREFEVRALYDFISLSMPRQRRNSPIKPGSLSEETYTAIIAHIFRSNGFPAGDTPLTKDAMKTIQIEGREGPRPVPTGALVQTVGCLTRRGSQWYLTRATEPARTQVSGASTEEEWAKALAKTLEQHEFQLSNMGYLGADFDPAVFAGHKMQTKGYLVRQEDGNRINLTSMESISAECQ